jgi:hypothetical protein
MKIIIVGGGTAGWLAALIISKRHPNHDITVTESTNIGIIGAGEGSTGSLTNIIQNITYDYGCNEKDFVEQCDVTAKLGIEFFDWSGNGKSYISPIDGSITSQLPFDYTFAYSLAEYDIGKMHLCSQDGILIENNKDTLSLPDGPAAYHFDAHKVGKYFKKICPNVKSIDGEVLDVLLDENGFVSKLILKDKTEITADFFVDATGFSRVICNKLGSSWHSYKDKLPVDTAMPFILKYDKNEIVKPVTKARAQKNGWMWEIPLLNRKGCGYVFSNNFLSIDNAQQEIENYLGKSIEPIKIINFDSGRLNELWIKNCLSIGLSAAFAEPLEATSIHTTITQLEDFCNYICPTVLETCNEKAIQQYNLQHTFMYDLLKDFLVLHYHAGRSDTEFWRYVNQESMLTTQVKEIIDICKIRLPNHASFLPLLGVAGWPLWSFILAGTGNLLPKIAKKDLKENRVQEFSKTQFENFLEYHQHVIKPYTDNSKFLTKRRLL